MDTWAELVGQLASLPDLPGARCRGRHELFDATIVGVRGAPPEDVEYARAAAAALCAQCPALHECRQWLDNQPPNARPLGIIAGYVSTPKGLRPMTLVSASDNRRATSLVVHWGRQDIDGVNAILKESVEVTRVTPLILATLDLHRHVVPILLTRDGLACLSATIFCLLDEPNHSDETRRAARIITAHSEGDNAGINDVLKEAAAADEVTELIISVLSLMSTLVPMLYCELGLQVLERSALDWAAREEDTDQ